MTRARRTGIPPLAGGLAFFALHFSGPAGGQQAAPTPPPAQSPAPLPAVPPPAPEDRPLAIDLAAALRLADARASDVIAAAERVRAAAARLDQARVLWLPTLTLGGDYNRHDGKIQNVQGDVVDASRGSWMLGAGTGIGSSAVLSFNEAVFAPLAARQQVRAREADLQTASNDTLVAVTDAYFTVAQARGELAGAADATRRTEEVARRTRALASGLVAPLESVRAEAELARRRQAEELALERWAVAGAELLRVLRLDPAARVVPVEPPDLRVEMVPLDRPVDDLIPVALRNRPELASRRAQVEATLTLLRQEKLRPLVPSLLVRGFSTPVTGTLAAGVFGGGTNGSLGNTGLRGDVDVQLLWQLDNLGLGNHARVREREAENRLALAELFRVQDRVAAEVAQAYAQAGSAARRAALAVDGVRLARESADKNLEALGQTRRVGELVQTLVRPQEALAAVQALAQAYADFYGAVADANRAQFRLYRALGNPARCAPDALPQPAPPPDAGTAAGVTGSMGGGPLALPTGR